MYVVGESCRFDRYDEIYVSPHLDDVVYSCAGRVVQQRKAGLKILVVTLFGDGAKEPVSQLTGRFADFQTRREEDRAAMARLDADYVWLNYPDFVFRRPTAGDVLRIAFPFLKLPGSAMQASLVSDLLELCEARLAEGGRVLCPLGVGFHPDHRIAFDLGRALHDANRFQVEFYEEIPYALAPVMVALRLRYLGLSTETPVLRSAREMNYALFRFFKVPWLTFIPTFLYFVCLHLVQRLTRSQDRLPGEPPPKRSTTRRIDDVIEDKVSAMRLYPTQTELFLAMDERLYGLLRESAGFFERTWSFPTFSSGRSRIARLGQGTEQKGVESAERSM
jgi:LmbE family N-acetylglucosaminyl deacetylase